ncbi:MAG: LCP family protein [Chloroflexi bacterium]|nr:LCP family protein [Chloroflexota bacterium]
MHHHTLTRFRLTGAALIVLLSALLLVSTAAGLAPQATPTGTSVLASSYTPPATPPVVPIPPRVDLLEDADHIVNILVIGSDTTGETPGRTDTLILVSINREAGSVAMWHVPRDLFVYIPDYTMERINVAFEVGYYRGYPGGGYGLLKETFLYNFGIEVDFYAHVNFYSFQRLVEELGGLVISVDCAIQDWRLQDGADPTLGDSYELFTLPVGRHRLTPDLALWYVRSRFSSNDLDRGRRQMDVLRAMWLQARELGLLSQVTELWPALTEAVTTDMTMVDALELVPLALSLDPGDVARYGGREGVHFRRTFTPGDGRDVLLPNRDALLPLLRDFLTPPTSNRVQRQGATVEVVDAAWYGLGFDVVAADRLAWEGFRVTPTGPGGEVRRELTVIYDYTGWSKGNPVTDLQAILRVDDAHVIRQPDPNRAVDFRVEIGTAYNTCIYTALPNAPPPDPPELP